MNSLYYVTAYKWSGNEWWRFLLTAKSTEDARDQILDYEPSLSQVNVRYVCQTPDPIWTEL